MTEKIYKITNDRYSIESFTGTFDELTSSLKEIGYGENFVAYQDEIRDMDTWEVVAVAVQDLGEHWREQAEKRVQEDPDLRDYRDILLPSSASIQHLEDVATWDKGKLITWVEAVQAEEAKRHLSQLAADIDRRIYEETE